MLAYEIHLIILTIVASIIITLISWIAITYCIWRKEDKARSYDKSFKRFIQWLEEQEQEVNKKNKFSDL